MQGLNTAWIACSMQHAGGDCCQYTTQVSALSMQHQGYKARTFRRSEARVCRLLRVPCAALQHGAAFAAALTLALTLPHFRRPVLSKHHAAGL